MRKLSTIFIFICLCSTFIGYNLVFNYQLNVVKSEMKAFLKDQKQDKDVVQILLNEEEAKQVYWEDENEFRYNSEMYDVVEKQVQGKLIVIRCIQDEKETSLLNEYQKNRKHNPDNSTIVQLITAQFDLPADTSLQLPTRIIEKVFTAPSYYIPKIASTVFLPPPDVC